MFNHYPINFWTDSKLMKLDMSSKSILTHHAIWFVRSPTGASERRWEDGGLCRRRISFPIADPLMDDFKLCHLVIKHGNRKSSIDESSISNVLTTRGYHSWVLRRLCHASAVRSQREQACPEHHWFHEVDTNLAGICVARLKYDYD